MKKRFLTIVFFFISTSAILIAQVPEQMSYQAIVRDSHGQLVVNQSLSATVKVRIGATDVFNQTYNVTTNAHGLLTLNFGDPVFMSINWENATISCEVKQGGTIYMAENFQPVMAVPLSLYAISMNRDTLHSYLDRDSNILHIRHYMEQNRTYIIYNDIVIHQALEDTAAHIRREMATMDSAIRSALVDTASYIRSALVDSSRDIRIALVDSAADIRSALMDTAADIRTFIGIREAAVRSALLDTAADLRNAINMPETQNLDSVLSLGNDAGSRQIKNLQDPTDPQDAVTKLFLENFSSLRVGNGDTLFIGSSQWIIIPGISIPNGMLNIPEVITTSISTMIDVSATSGGNVTSDGNTTLTARGVCWSTSPNPTLSNSYTDDGIASGVFTSSITGLTANTNYYVRAYATNSVGTAYGNEVVFRTLPSCVDGITDIEGNHYSGVKIGSQCWMRENLRVTKYATGTTIALAGGTIISNSTPYRYYPNGDEANVSTYGYLYNWPATMNSLGSSPSNPSGIQGVCPDGWHLPSVEEWTQLTDYVSAQPAYHCNADSTYIAKALASTSGWVTFSGACYVGDNPSANNATGFSAVPAGEHNAGSLNFGYGVRLWSATEASSTNAYFLYMYYVQQSVFSLNSDKSHGYSVRCLRDY